MNDPILTVHASRQGVINFKGCKLSMYDSPIQVVNYLGSDCLRDFVAINTQAWRLSRVLLSTMRMS